MSKLQSTAQPTFEIQEIQAIVTDGIREPIPARVLMDGVEIFRSPAFRLISGIEAVIHQRQWTREEYRRDGLPFSRIFMLANTPIHGFVFTLDQKSEFSPFELADICSFPYQVRDGLMVVLKDVRINEGPFGPGEYHLDRRFSDQEVLLVACGKDRAGEIIALDPDTGKTKSVVTPRQYAATAYTDCYEPRLALDRRSGAVKLNQHLSFLVCDPKASISTDIRPHLEGLGYDKALTALINRGVTRAYPPVITQEEAFELVGAIYDAHEDGE